MIVRTIPMVVVLIAMVKSIAQKGTIRPLLWPSCRSITSLASLK